MLAWIAYALLCGGAVSAIAAAADTWTARRGSTRRWVWAIAMPASVLVPVALSLRTAAPTIVIDAAPSASTAGVISNKAAGAWTTDEIVLFAWAACSIALAAWLACVLFQLRRRVRSCDTARVGGTTVQVSDDFGPAVIGAIHPTIVLPRWVQSFDEEDQRVIVAHETEHVVASDPLVHAAALGLVVLVPWNLALWWQLDRLRFAIEVDCDARVVARHARDRRRYGELLVAAVAHGRAPIGAALALAQWSSSLGRRIETLMLAPNRSLRRAASVVAMALASTAVLAAIPAPTIRAPHIVSVNPPATQRELAPVTPSTPTPTPSATIVGPQAKRAVRRSTATVSFMLPPLQVTQAGPRIETPLIQPAPRPIRATARGFVFRRAPDSDATATPIGQARIVSSPNDSVRTSPAGVIRARPRGQLTMRPDTTSFPH